LLEFLRTEEWKKRPKHTEREREREREREVLQRVLFLGVG
jgi:hypothetical protein